MRCRQAFFRALFAGAAIAGFVLASVPPVTAALYSPQQALPQQTIQQFLSNPTALLAQYPNGGSQMIAQIRDLVASDPATVNAVLGLLNSANPDQASAIGTALGHVALMAVTTDQAFASQIQTLVAQAGNASALAAFSAVVGGNIKLTAATTAVGGGGGGEAPTSPGGGGGFSTGPSSPTLPTFSNSPDTFSSLTLGGPSAGSPSSLVVSP